MMVKKKKMSIENQKKLFIDLFETFLNMESEEKNKIPLSNKERRTELKKTYQSLKETQPISAESISKAISEILRVRQDPSIWDNGLALQYTTFREKYKPTMGCLLSIL